MFNTNAEMVQIMNVLLSEFLQTEHTFEIITYNKL